MPPSGSHGSEEAWMPAGPRLYETAYVLLVCMYPPCPPGAFLFAIRAKGMLPVEGSYGSPEVPGPQYLRGDQPQHGELTRHNAQGQVNLQTTSLLGHSHRKVTSATLSANAAPAHTRHHLNLCSSSGARDVQAWRALTGCCRRIHFSSRLAEDSASTTQTTACTRAP